MRQTLSLFAYILVVGITWAAALLGMASMVDESKAQHTTTSSANAAPARPIPCFFLGTPYVRDPHACKEFGGVRLVMWETYCNPDPSCMKNPDGTSFLTP